MAPKTRDLSVEWSYSRFHGADASKTASDLLHDSLNYSASKMTIKSTNQSSSVGNLNRLIELSITLSFLLSHRHFEDHEGL
jgi:hypothetical protein